MLASRNSKKDPGFVFRAIHPAACSKKPFYLSDVYGWTHQVEGVVELISPMFLKEALRF